MTCRFQRLVWAGVVTGVVTGVIAGGSLASAASAMTPAIGFVTAKGIVQLDASPVGGQGTLFEGSTVETKEAGSRLQISRDGNVSLGSASRATVFRNHMALETGDSELAGATNYWLEARGLQIRPMESDASARVSLRTDPQVMVTAVGGAVRVADEEGTLIAWVPAGRTLRLDPQDGGGASGNGSAAPAGAGSGNSPATKRRWRKGGWIWAGVGGAAVAGTTVGLTRRRDTISR